MNQTKEQILEELHQLWEEHDALERRIIQLERHFTDEELDNLLER